MIDALRVLWLAMSLCAARPAQAPESCGAHALLASRAAEVAGLDPRLVLAIAIVESDLVPDVVSRTGRHCGVLQAMGRGSACKKLLYLGPGYAAGGRELRYWRRRCRGREHCVLAGHGGGNAWAKRCESYPRCPRYVAKVTRWRRRLGR